MRARATILITAAVAAVALTGCSSDTKPSTGDAAGAVKSVAAGAAGSTAGAVKPGDEVKVYYVGAVKEGAPRVEFPAQNSLYTVTWKTTDEAVTGTDGAVIQPPSGGGFVEVQCYGQNITIAARPAITDTCTINDGDTKIALESPFVRHKGGVAAPQTFAVGSITGLTATITVNGETQTVQLQ